MRGLQAGSCCHAHFIFWALLYLSHNKVFQVILYLPVLVLKSAVSPRSPDSFSWGKVFRNEDLGKGNLISKLLSITKIKRNIYIFLKIFIFMADLAISFLPLVVRRKETWSLIFGFFLIYFNIWLILATIISKEHSLQ